MAVLRPVGGKAINYRDERTLYVLSGRGEPASYTPVLGINCGHKFLSDRRFIAHLLSKEPEVERHVILNEQEMAEKNRTLENLKQEKANRNASGAAQMSATDLLHQMNQMKGEIMDKLNEIKTHLESQID